MLRFIAMVDTLTVGGTVGTSWLGASMITQLRRATSQCIFQRYLDVRMKTHLEVRRIWGRDMCWHCRLYMPDSYMMTRPWTGYSASSISWTIRLLEMRDHVPQHGFAIPSRRQTVGQLADEIMDIAADGLSRWQPGHFLARTRSTGGRATGKSTHNIRQHATSPADILHFTRLF